MVPHIGTKGIFKLKTPFDVKHEGSILEVTGIRSFQDLELEGVDVKSLIYIKEGLTETDYNNGVENKDTIIIFKGTSNQVYRIPSSYIVNTPVTDGVFFKDIYLTIPVGYIPESYDLTKTKKKLEDLLAKELGVLTKCNEVEGNKRIIFTKQEVDEFEKRVLMNREGRGFIDYEEQIEELRNTNHYLSQQNEDLGRILNDYASGGMEQKPEYEPSEEEINKSVQGIVIEVTSKSAKDNVVIGNLTFYKYPYQPLGNPIDLDTLVSSPKPNRFAFENGKYVFTMGTTTGHIVSLGTRANPPSVTEPLSGVLIPQVFSVSARAKFKPEYAKIEIQFKEPINIQGLTFSTDDEILDTGNKYKIRTYNKRSELLHCMEGMCVMNKLAGDKKLTKATGPSQDVDLQ